MKISKKFSEEEKEEIERALSKVPEAHLESTEFIQKISSLGEHVAAIANYSIFDGGEVVISAEFYKLNEKEREFTLLHEIGHNYFSYFDEKIGNRFDVRFGPCRKENVDHLLRVQWMEIGEWELDEEKLKEIKWIWPGNDAHKNKYTYTVKCNNPNRKMGEWVCPEENMINKNGSKLSFSYDEPDYSPIEEIADAYVLFILAKEFFEKQTGRNKVIESKYEFIREQFN